MIRRLSACRLLVALGRFAMLGTLALAATMSVSAASVHHEPKAHKAHAAAVSAHAHAPAAKVRKASHGNLRAAKHAETPAHGRAAARAVSQTRLVRGRHGRLVRVDVRAATRPWVVVERFHASSFTDSPVGVGDVTTGEDATVRAAAIDALGNMNGTAVAIDPSTGRILAMVNQNLALSSGAEPCSTIKLTVALAALQEGLVRKDTPVALGGSYHVTLTDALAKSNNLYFETLGRALGFERVKHYANQLGLGELAGYGIPGEHLGTYPDQELPAASGGVGRMCSFGESVSMTPLQLGAIVSAIANGGTLYYLQHPTSADAIASFQPKVKRILDISSILPEMRPGMLGAVYYGTARSLRTNFTEFPVMGKTGTCSNNGLRFGWFGSYADTPKGRIVTVIFLEGGRPTFGPKAAELTGQFYRSLYDRNYFGHAASSDAAAAAVGYTLALRERRVRSSAEIYGSPDGLKQSLAAGL